MSNAELSTKRLCVLAICILALFAGGCSNNKSSNPESREVPHEGQWGVYSLDLLSMDVALLYSTNNEITGLDLNSSGTKLALAIKTQSDLEIDTTSEIYTLDINTHGLTRLTENDYFDCYPSFSPDDSQIVFLSMRESTLDLYIMDSDGTNQELLYNSGGHARI